MFLLFIAELESKVDNKLGKVARGVAMVMDLKGLKFDWIKK